MSHRYNQQITASSLLFHTSQCAWVDHLIYKEMNVIYEDPSADNILHSWWNLEFHAGANDQVCRHLSNDFWVVLVRIIWRFESPDLESLAARWDAGASNEDAFFAVQVVLSICSSSSQSQMFVKSDLIRSRRCWRLRIFVSFVCHWHMEFTQSSLAS